MAMVAPTWRRFKSSDYPLPNAYPTTVTQAANQIVDSLCGALEDGELTSNGVPSAGWIRINSGTDGLGRQQILMRNSAAHGGKGILVLLSVDTSNFRILVQAGRTYTKSGIIITLGQPTTEATLWVHTAADYPAEWEIFADELTFYIVSKATPAVTSSMLSGAGEFISFWPGDAYNYFVMHPNQQHLRYGLGTSMNSTNGWIRTGGRNNSYIQLNGCLLSALGSVNGSGTAMAATNSAPATNPPNGALILQPAFFRNGNYNEVSGKLRHFYVGGNFRTPTTYTADIPTAQHDGPPVTEVFTYNTPFYIDNPSGSEGISPTPPGGGELS